MVKELQDAPLPQEALGCLGPVHWLPSPAGRHPVPAHKAKHSQSNQQADYRDNGGIFDAM